MAYLTPGARIGTGRATRGLIMRDPDHSESRATFGLIGGRAESLADITIIPIQPLDGAINVGRGDKWVVHITDGVETLIMSTLSVRYRQQPYPAESVDGWVQVMTGLTFEPGFDGTVSVGSYLLGQIAIINIQPLFGLLPGSTGTLEVTIEDGDGNEVSETWSFAVADNAPSVSLRDVLYRLRRQAERYSWDPLLAATPTYDFQVDPAITGADIEIAVNESLVADFADQLSSSPFGLDILNNVRRYKLLSKPIEYAREADDAQALELHDGFVDGTVPSPVMADRKLPGAQHKEQYTDTNLLERAFRYYTLLILVPPSEETGDWFWAYADNVTFARAFPYGRYGHGAKLYSFMPEAWQVIDGELP